MPVGIGDVSAVREVACEKIMTNSQEKVVSYIHGTALCKSAIFIAEVSWNNHTDSSFAWSLVLTPHRIL